MTNIMPLTPVGGVELESPKDAHALRIVVEVMDWMREHGSSNVSAACEALGVDRRGLYRMYKRPAVKAEIHSVLAGMDMAVVAMVEKRWLTGIKTLFDIATDRSDEKAAVQAMRLLWDIKRETQKSLEQDERASGPSEARLLLDKMRGMPQTIRASRRVVEETVEISPDEGEIVDAA